VGETRSPITQHRADNRDATAIHRLAASRPPRATATSPPAAGSDTERRSAGGPAPRSMARAGRAIGTAPNPRRRGEGCARIMVRAERNVSLARARAIDERDHQVLLHLLEHKILTTHQIASLHFRSLRRCQHQMRELKDLGLVSSFSVGSPNGI
jgi:hypothetical protein